MKIAVCDDNTKDRHRIYNYIENYCTTNGFLVELFAYSDAESLLEAYFEEKFNIIFMDIIMGNMTGIDAARRIREHDASCIIVFTTVSEQYSLDAYSVDGLAYLLKPAREEEVERVLDKCRREFVKNSKFISVSTKEQGDIDIPLAEILYIEVRDKQIDIHLDTKMIVTTHMPLEKISELIGGEPFLRCHRSYIVNMNHVDKLHDGVFLMKNGEEVLIPKRNYKEIQKLFGDYITKKLKEEC